MKTAFLPRILELRGTGFEKFPDGKLYQVDLAADWEDESILNDEERQRSERFRHAPSKSNFVAMRTALRVVLAEELRCSEREIEFGYQAHGKPFLRYPEASVWFNISHTDRLGVIALSRKSDLGVDVERIQFKQGLVEIAERFFSHQEWEQIQMVPFARQTQAFYRIWTRKEAVLKLTGTGLSTALDAFSVSLDDSARILESTLPELSRDCTLVDLELGFNFAGCVACWDSK